MLPAYVRVHFVLFLITVVSACALQPASEIPEQCVNNCVTEYGTVLGIAAPDIPAYSNCQSSCVYFDPYHYEETYTGIKWQCVEFARRWLLIHNNIVYGDVDIAADIWTKIDHYLNVKTKERIPVASYTNGSSQRPGTGDLLIYARAFHDTGHVAVITDIDFEHGEIEVAEQNFTNTPWPGDYARKINFINVDGKYWILDSYLLGWKQIKPQESK